MRFKPPGRFRTAEEFRARLQAIDPAFDCDAEIEGANGPLARPVDLGEGRRIGNRFCAHPMEGWDATPDGLPSEHTLRRWHRFGRSGAKLIWGGEAFAVQEDGRANPNQLFLNPEADVAGALAQLRGRVLAGHGEQGLETDDLCVGLQLTHSGRFSRPTAAGAAPRIACHHPVLDPRFGIAPEHPVLTDAELEGIGENFVRVARLAADAGYDFVDVKCCHGYLLHELLGAREREGTYGGPFENRTRLFHRIVSRIRTACPGLALGVRVSIGDVFPFSADAETGVGTPHGWQERLPYAHGFGIDANDPRRCDLEEPMRFLGLVRELGIRLVNITLGSPYYCPHLQRPAAFPPSDGYQPPTDPLVGVFEHLKCVRACKAAFPDLLLVGTGYSYLQEYLPHVAQYEVGKGHVDFVGLGRQMLAYPELPFDVLHGRPADRKRLCRTFSDCTTAPRNGMVSGCFPLDRYYGDLPEAERLKEIKRSLRE